MIEISDDHCPLLISDSREDKTSHVTEKLNSRCPKFPPTKHKKGGDLKKEKLVRTVILIVILLSEHTLNMEEGGGHEGGNRKEGRKEGS